MYEVAAVHPQLVPVLQEALRLVQLARKEGGQARVDAALLGRLGELEAELTAALAKANRENAGVYLQVRSHTMSDTSPAVEVAGVIACAPYMFSP